MTKNTAKAHLITSVVPYYHVKGGVGPDLLSSGATFPLFSEILVQMQFSVDTAKNKNSHSDQKRTKAPLRDLC